MTCMPAPCAHVCWQCLQCFDCCDCPKPVEHDWMMPHDIRFFEQKNSAEGCPPNCPFRLHHEENQ